MINFMLFDLLCFVLVIGWLCYYTFYVNRITSELEIKQTILFVQVIYGLLNLPWIIFAFKPCVLFLSKSRETGYDRDGNCVPKYLASDMYKIRFGKKRIIINSKGISFKVDQLPNKAGDTTTAEIVKEGSGPEEDGGFSIDVDIQDLIKFENIFKLS